MIRAGISAGLVGSTATLRTGVCQCDIPWKGGQYNESDIVALFWIRSCSPPIPHMLPGQYMLEILKIIS